MTCVRPLSGQEGGLYPGGAAVRPVLHDLDLDRVGRVMLLNPQGQPDAGAGKIVLMSVGMSNTTQEFSAFVPLANADPVKNSRFLLGTDGEASSRAGRAPH